MPDVDTADRQRLQGQAEVEVRQAVLLVLCTEQSGTRVAAGRAKSADLEIVGIIANAAVQNDLIVVVGGVDHIAAGGIDRDLGREAGPLRVGIEGSERELRRKDTCADDVSARRSAGKRFRAEASVFIDA